jgi:large repetitive protein
MEPTPRFRSPGRLFAYALAAGLALALASLGPAAVGPAAPVLLGPGDGTSVDTPPPFAWQPVAGAEKYEFELSADAGFNSDVAYVTTRNTRAALRTVIPNGRYFWHVRAVTAAGGLGAWSPTRTLQMTWTARPSLLAPASGATLTYPLDAFKLSWTPVPGASEYRIRVATDPALGSLVWAAPVETAATTFTLASPLAPGTYYWAITPLNAEGHAGTQSSVATFTWAWPSVTSTSFTDLAPAPEIVDPYFAWDRVPGASGYEVEVNSSSDWAPGSKVCCSPLRFGSNVTTLGLSLSPPEQLDNNTYYWRVRALDPRGNAGLWNVGQSFTKTFANVPPTPAPSVKNLRLRDNLGDPLNGADPATVPYPLSTGVPILTWNPVPGASSYQVDVTPFESGACNWSAPNHWVKMTSSTSWTPLGWGWNGVKPFPNPAAVATESQSLVSGGSYCARVRPVDRASTSAGPTVFGDWAYLPENNVAAFTYTAPPGPGSCSPCALAPADYRGPQTGTTLGRMPLFTWQPIAGARSYYVIVARDPSFTNVVDYAFTRIPAYAPRTGSVTVGYPDELTLYYWAVLPALELNGSGVSASPLGGAPPSFQKQSTPPTLVAPGAGSQLNGPVTFRWTSVEAARRYRIQVAQDPSFANPIDDQTTDSTAYTSNTTYPADTVLYWRVRADAEDGSGVVGLAWSAPLTFQRQLPAPTPDPSNPTGGPSIPTLAWSPIPGAVSYDVHVEEADGDARNFPNLPSHAFTPTKMTGVGIFRVQARANFPTPSGSVVHGPYSPLMSFARTIPEPGGATTDSGPSHVLLGWNARAGAKEYRVEVAGRPDFAALAERVTTQATNHAPTLVARSYVEGGRLYWRVAAVDADGNVGDFTAVQEFGLLQTMRVRAIGSAMRGRRTTLTVLATTGRSAVPGARIRVRGAGVRAQTRTANALGRATFSIRPTKRGNIIVQATKAGFRPVQTAVAVRTPTRR